MEARPEAREIDQLVPGSGLLLGRDVELADLQARLDDALDGRGTLVLLVGEAGIGKTRLADEFVRQAKAAGAAIAWGTGLDDEAVPHYWPWIQVLRHCVRQFGAGALKESGSAEQELAPLLSDDGLGIRGDGHLTEPGDPRMRRFRLFHAMASLLERMSRERPLILVLDDLQWADKPSLLLLEFLASQLHGSRLLLLGCYRSSDVSREDICGDAPTPLLRHSATIMLNGLDESDAIRLLQHTAGTPINEKMAALLYDRTAGNPLFLQETVRLLAAQGRLTDAYTSATALPALPPTVREVIGRRLARLSDSCARVLAAASVSGTEFDLDILAPVVRLSPRGLADRLDEAVRARVIMPSANASGRYRFAHPLIREVLYGDLSPSSRAGLHRRVGEAIERAVTEPDAKLTALARHFYLAAMTGGREKALDYGRRAGRRALGMLAYEEAAEHLTHALQMLDLLGGEESDRVELLLELGNARLRAGHGAAAAGAYEQAASSARRRREPAQLARAALGVGAGPDGFEVRLFDERQIELLREALDVLGGKDSSLRAWTLARLSVATSFVEPAHARRAWSQEAAAVARRVGDKSALTHALAAYCDAISALDHVEERLEAATEIVTIAQEHGFKEMELLGRRLHVVALLESGDVSAVDAEIDAFERAAEALRQPLYRWYVPLWKGMRAVMEGRLDDCDRFLEQAQAIGEQAGSRNAQILTFSLGLLRLLERGQAEDACKLHEQFVGEPESGANNALFGIGMRARAGRRVEAHSQLSALAADDFAQVVMDDAAAVAGLCLAADAAADLGHRAAASKLYEILRPHAPRFAVSGIAAACLGSVAGFLGRLAHVLERWDEAEKHFAHAANAHRRAGATLLLAHTLRHHAAMNIDRAEADGNGQAKALLEQATCIYAGLGLTQWAETSAELVDEPRSESRDAGQNTFRREGELWLLRFAGEEARVPDVKGLHDLACLLASPGKEFHVLDLAAGGNRVEGRGVRADDLHEQGHLGPLVDDQARAQYKRRMDELAKELDEAEALDDRERAERARIERDELIAHLAAAYGLGGRPRRAGDPTQRARSAVTWRIRSALGRIERAHPALGHHLAHCVKTGTYCCYAPEQPVKWTP